MIFVIINITASQCVKRREHAVEAEREGERGSQRRCLPCRDDHGETPRQEFRGNIRMKREEKERKKRFW